MSGFGTLTRLGDALEVVTQIGPRRTRHVWGRRRRVPLLWSPSWAALLVVLGGRELAEVETPAGAARKVRERWQRERADRSYRFELPAVDAPWVDLGAAVRTDYWSDKWGESVEREHQHESGVRAWSLGDLRSGPGYLLVQGGRLRITSRGIEG